MKRSELRAAQYRIFRRARLPAGALEVKMDKRIQFRLQRLDAFKMEFDNFDGGYVLGSNFLSDFREGAVREEAHWWMGESKRSCGCRSSTGQSAQFDMHKNG